MTYQTIRVNTQVTLLYNKKIIIPIRKTGKNRKRHFMDEEKVINKYVERCLTSLIKDMQIKTILTNPFKLPHYQKFKSWTNQISGIVN